MAEEDDDYDELDDDLEAALEEDDIDQGRTVKRRVNRTVTLHRYVKVHLLGFTKAR